MRIGPRGLALYPVKSVGSSLLRRHVVKFVQVLYRDTVVLSDISIHPLPIILGLPVYLNERPTCFIPWTFDPYILSRDSASIVDPSFPFKVDRASSPSHSPEPAPGAQEHSI